MGKYLRQTVKCQFLVKEHHIRCTDGLQKKMSMDMDKKFIDFAHPWTFAMTEHESSVKRKFRKFIDGYNGKMLYLDEEGISFYSIRIKLQTINVVIS